jgi:hypothetical protein
MRGGDGTKVSCLADGGEVLGRGMVGGGSRGVAGHGQDEGGYGGRACLDVCVRMDQDLEILDQICALRHVGMALHYSRCAMPCGGSGRAPHTMPGHT